MDKDLKLMLSTLDLGGLSYKKISVKHYWCGGASGAENDWNNPDNWYNRNIPGWFDQVVVSSRFYKSDHFPVIELFVNDISQLIIDRGARLIVAEQGRISIDGLGKKGLGIMNDGEIFIQGELTIQRTTYACIRNAGLICNTGSLAMDKTGARGVVGKKEGVLNNWGEITYL